MLLALTDVLIMLAAMIGLFAVAVLLTSRQFRAAAKTFLATVAVVAVYALVHTAVAVLPF
jgi:hypothetical protein